MAEIKEAKLSDLVFDDKNFNKHTEYGMSLIEKSIRNNGAGRSILIDKNNRIIAGNGVTEIAGQIGLDDVQIVETDGTKIIAVKRTDIDLDSKQGREMALADNATASVDLDWDEEAIAEVEDEFDIDAGDWGVNLDFETEQPTATEDDFDESTDAITTRCKKGDVWLLGEHRLMCGDSTSADDVAKLMDGAKADITFTSPPYNIARGPKWNQVPNPYLQSKGCNGAYGEYEDNLSDEDYSKLLINALDNGITHTDEVIFNIGFLGGNKAGVVNMLHQRIDFFADMLYWKKLSAMSLGLPSQKRMVSHYIEPLYCFTKQGTRAHPHSQWDIAKGVDCVETKNASNNEYSKIHNATFPVEFASHFVSNFSDKSVLDLFGGTGTTLIACEQLNRKCFMMELDPHYCDVIIARWEKLTGKNARRITDG